MKTKKFETECELKKPAFLLKYSVLDSRVAGEVGFSGLAFPLLLLCDVDVEPPLLRDGNESNASPETKCYSLKLTVNIKF